MNIYTVIWEPLSGEATRSSIDQPPPTAETGR